MRQPSPFWWPSPPSCFGCRRWHKRQHSSLKRPCFNTQGLFRLGLAAKLQQVKQSRHSSRQTGQDPVVEWITSDQLVSYDEAVSFMETRAAAIAAGEADECIWLVEHPPLYTAGTSAKREDLRDADRFPVFESARGGQYTYHGPGQRVVYVMLNVGARGKDVRRFVKQLENWVIATLDQFNVKGEIREGRVGVWVERPEKPLTATGSPAEDKIAAIGIRLRRWVSFHGISINVEPDLTHFEGIVPCGINDHGVTSLVDLGLPVTMDDVDVALKQTFEEAFS
ncbi:lipoyl(octanoyl) transferase LipB [Epibacterium ulvae]|uniref:lipoyl(octanoyl) transferase LipB n=1 Tax=Epibacterium ulvae TaxID=1156985 RepID=UPI0022B7F746|nr:lipoyl(octanoyl) transferase LipB [Epibacterium ulvae]